MTLEYYPQVFYPESLPDFGLIHGLLLPRTIPGKITERFQGLLTPESLHSKITERFQGLLTPESLHSGLIHGLLLPRTIPGKMTERIQVLIPTNRFFQILGLIHGLFIIIIAYVTRLQIRKI